MTPRCSPSVTWNGRVWTSSRMARSAARATPTGSPRRSKGWIPRTRASPSTEPATRNPVPRVVGPIWRTRPVLVRDVRFLRANTERSIKATIPGPFTMSQQAQDDHYGDEEALAMALAAAVNAEVRDLFAAGADVVQLDEP